jgi:hypothetical protein
MVRPVVPRLLLAAAICAGALAAASTPASAQWPFFMPRDAYPRDPYHRPQYRPPPPPSPFYGFPREPRRQIEAAPTPVPEEPSGTIYGSTEAADKHRTSQANHYVLVVGDTLADQLAQGLADAFVVERPEVAIVKKTRASSGLVRADFYDWPAQLPALLEAEKPSAIAVILGTNDRQVLRDDKGAYEIRSDRWRELYVLRIEAFVNELKKKGVPVFLVGLPSMRIARLSADLQYINEILREQAVRLGVYYIDIWDGFVGENDEFAMFGPALDGQRRRLRVDDGVHFTRVGARKAAHYVERDLIRLFDQGPRGPSIPQEAPEAAPAPTGRPVAGPVVPLTQPAGPVGQLLGAGAPTQSTNDGIASRVLVEGRPVEPVSGRADDFRWPRGPDGSAPAAGAGNATTPQAAGAADPSTTNSMPAKAAAPLPNVITPSGTRARIAPVPEANRTR